MLVIANRWTDQLSVSTVPCLCPQQNHLVAIVPQSALQMDCRSGLSGISLSWHTTWWGRGCDTAIGTTTRWKVRA